MTPFELVREVARTFGQELDDGMCETILWGETTFPMKRISSKDALAALENQPPLQVEFFESGTLPGQRQEEIIEELRAKGEWPGG